MKVEFNPEELRMIVDALDDKQFQLQIKCSFSNMCNYVLARWFRPDRAGAAGRLSPASKFIALPESQRYTPE
jgi:hypothetical protein